MRVVFQQFVIDQHALAAEEDTVGKDKGRSTLGLAVDCFGAAVQVIHEHYPDKMLDFLNTVIAPPSEGDGGRPGDRHSMAHHLKVLQQLVGQLITAKAQYTKEAATVLGVIKVVLSHVTVDRSGHATRVKKWLIKLCEEQNIDDATLTKTAVVFLFSLLRTQDDISGVVSRFPPSSALFFFFFFSFLFFFFF